MREYIVSIPGVENGLPLIKGTRLPVSFVLKQFSLGWNINEIVERYPEIDIRLLGKIVTAVSDAISADIYAHEKTYHPRNSYNRRQSNTSL